MDSSALVGTMSVTRNTGFFAELSNTDRLRDCRLPGVLNGDINSEFLLTEGDLNTEIVLNYNRQI